MISVGLLAGLGVWATSIWALLLVIVLVMWLITQSRR